MDNKKYKTTVTKNDDSTVEIEASIPAEEFEGYKKTVIKKLGKDVKVAGFRKGHVPEKVLIEKIGEQTVLYEMAEMALAKAYPQIITQEKIDAISQPEIKITKIAKGNPLEFKAKTSVMPEIELPDYKKIAKKSLETNKEEPEITDKEFEDALLRIRRSLASKEKPAEEVSKLKDEELPELNDENVKELGPYENVEDFKKKARESMTEEKKRQAAEKRRMKMIEDILKETKISVPDILIDSELKRMVAQFKADIERMGMKVEEYMKTVGKTEEDMKKEWRPDAKKRVESELLLVEIGKKEDLKPDEKEIKKETEHLMTHHPNANESALRAYVANTLHHQKVLEFLEQQ